MPTLAVYPGSFDPLTNGHVDIISRGARMFDRIIVAILVNAEKSPMLSDFEFEFQMALMNQRLKPQIETVFMMPAEQYTYISSRLIKEVFALGGRVHGLVPELVEQRLREKGLAKK